MDGRLAQMEVALEEYKSNVSKLEEELEKSRNGGGSTSSLGTTNAQVQELVARAKEVQGRNEELEKGRFSSSQSLVKEAHALKQSKSCVPKARSR